MTIRNELPHVQPASVDALELYVSDGRSRIDELRPHDLVRLRSAEGLLVRLQWALERKASLSAAMLSPTDVVGLNDLAKVAPADREVFAALGAELAGILTMRKSSTRSTLEGVAAYPR